jgi:hypothetical protein
MAPTTGTSRRGMVYTCYKCSAATKKGKFACEGITIPRRKAGVLVTEALAERLLQPERVLSILEEFAAKRQSRQASVNQRIADLQIEAATVEKALQNFYRGIAAGAIDPSEPTLATMLKDLTQKRDSRQYRAGPRARNLIDARHLRCRGRSRVLHRIAQKGFGRRHRRPQALDHLYCQQNRGYTRENPGDRPKRQLRKGP